MITKSTGINQLTVTENRNSMLSATFSKLRNLKILLAIANKNYFITYTNLQGTEKIGILVSYEEKISQMLANCKFLYAGIY